MSEFIDQLPISDEQREQVRSLGVDSPESLFSLIKAAPDDFRRFMGPETAKRVASTVETLIPDAVRRSLERPLPHFATGAMLTNPPNLSAPSYDMNRRNSLFTELQQLRSDPAQQNSPRVAELETELNQMLENRF